MKMRNHSIAVLQTHQVNDRKEEETMLTVQIVKGDAMPAMKGKCLIEHCWKMERIRSWHAYGAISDSDDEGDQCACTRWAEAAVRERC